MSDQEDITMLFQDFQDTPSCKWIMGPTSASKGLLCPFCKKKMTKVKTLRKHISENHEKKPPQATDEVEKLPKLTKRKSGGNKESH